jgi:hypothetical protein
VRAGQQLGAETVRRSRLPLMEALDAYCPHAYLKRTDIELLLQRFDYHQEDIKYA